MKTKKDNTIRIPVKLPEDLKKEMGISILNSGYGFKGRSKWVEEAINYLLSNSSYSHLVALDETIESSLSPDSFTINLETKDEIENALTQIKSIEPKTSPTVSSVVRTAIIQRLLRE